MRDRKFVQEVSIDVSLDHWTDQDIIDEIVRRDLEDKFDTDDIRLSTASDEQIRQDAKLRGMMIINANEHTHIEDHARDLFYDYIDGRPLDMKKFFMATLGERCL